MSASLPPPGRPWLVSAEAGNRGSHDIRSQLDHRERTGPRKPDDRERIQAVPFGSYRVVWHGVFQGSHGRPTNHARSLTAVRQPTPRRPDFEARVRFLSKERVREKTLTTGIRCDLQFDEKYSADPPNQVWIIYPTFLDGDRALLPMQSESRRMSGDVPDPRSRSPRHVHRARLHIGINSGSSRASNRRRARHKAVAFLSRVPG